MMKNSFHKELHSAESSEKGVVMLLFAFFIVTMIPLLALSIDSFFMMQGRLEEQNLAEYAALTSLDGYVRGINQSSPDHDNAKAQSLIFLKDMEGKNGVTGLASGSGWDFTPTSCIGNECSGSGWTMIFGTWDQLTSAFTPAPADIEGDPESINPTIINAVKFSMVIPDNGFVDFFRTAVMQSGGDDDQSSDPNKDVNSIHSRETSQEDGEHNGNDDSNISGGDKIKLPVSAVAYFVQDGSSKYFRLTRTKASGSDSI